MSSRTPRTGRSRLIEPVGFDLSAKQVRRAGLDYHDMALVTRHNDYSEFLQAMTGRRLFACTTKATQYYTQINYRSDDVLLFGSEIAGLPAAILASLPDQQKVRIPMLPASRSINLANAVAIISYEAWRQQNFNAGQ